MLPCYHLSHRPLRHTVESFRSRHLQHPATSFMVEACIYLAKLDDSTSDFSSYRLWEQEQEVPAIRPIVSNCLESVEKPSNCKQAKRSYNSRTSLEEHHLSCAARVMASSSSPLFKSLKLLKWSWDLIETNMLAHVALQRPA